MLGHSLDFAVSILLPPVLTPNEPASSRVVVTEFVSIKVGKISRVSGVRSLHIRALGLVCPFNFFSGFVLAERWIAIERRMLDKLMGD